MKFKKTITVYWLILHAQQVVYVALRVVIVVQIISMKVSLFRH